MIHGPAKHKLDESDFAMMQEIGVCSILGLSIWPIEDFQRIYDLGFRDLTLRLWHGQGVLPDPQDYLDEHTPLTNTLISIGFNLSISPTNEPNLENVVMTPQGFSAWLRQFIILFRQRFNLELISPALTPNYAYHPWEWMEACKDAFSMCDTVGVHYYWDTFYDLQPNVGWSPEWYREQFPGHDQRITECGGSDNTTKLWRYDTYPDILSRCKKLDYVKSFHVYIMSSEDDQWNVHAYDDHITSILKELNMPEEFSYSFGFKELYDANPDVIGLPISTQITIPDVFSVQFSEHGMLVYDPQSNTSKFIKQSLPKV